MAVEGHAAASRSQPHAERKFAGVAVSAQYRSSCGAAGLANIARRGRASLLRSRIASTFRLRRKCGSGQVLQGRARCLVDDLGVHARQSAPKAVCAAHMC